MKWARIESVKPMGISKPGVVNPNTIPKRNALSPAAEKTLAKYVTKLKKPTVASLHKQGFKEWLILKKDGLPQGFDSFDKADYEAFVGGFLYYFENYNTGIKDDDRTLLVDWGTINPKADMTIYLKPLYRDFYDKHQNEIGTKYQSGGGSGAGKKYRSPLASPPSDDQTDPPRPPYPPPPPRGFSDPT